MVDKRTLRDLCCDVSPSNSNHQWIFFLPAAVNFVLRSCRVGREDVLFQMDAPWIFYICFSKNKSIQAEKTPLKDLWNGRSCLNYSERCVRKKVIALQEANISHLGKRKLIDSIVPVFEGVMKWDIKQAADVMLRNFSIIVPLLGLVKKNHDLHLSKDI